MRDAISQSGLRLHQWLILSGALLYGIIYLGVLEPRGIAAWFANQPEVSRAFSDPDFGRADALILLFSTLFLGPLALLLGLIALVFVLAVFGGFLLPVVRWFRMPDWMATAAVLGGVVTLLWIETEMWLPQVDVVPRPAGPSLPDRRQRLTSYTEPGETALSPSAEGAESGPDEQRHADVGHDDHHHAGEHAGVAPAEQPRHERPREHPTVDRHPIERGPPRHLGWRRHRSQDPERQHPGRHAEAEQRAADCQQGQRAESDEPERQSEDEQHPAQHHRRAAPVGERTEWQQRRDVHDLGEHEQPRDPCPVEPELPAASQRNGELLDGRVAHRDRRTGRHREQGQERRRLRRAARRARRRPGCARTAGAVRRRAPAVHAAAPAAGRGWPGPARRRSAAPWPTIPTAAAWSAAWRR